MVKFKDFSRPFSVFEVLFKANLTFKDISSYRLVNPGIEPVTPGLQGKRFIYYTTAAHFRGHLLKTNMRMDAGQRQITKANF